MSLRTAKWLATAILAVAPLAACNMVSGADDLAIGNDDDDVASMMMTSSFS